MQANIDVAMTHDLTGPLAVKSFNEIGAKKVWDADKIVVILDHLVPASSVISAGLHKTMRDFVNEQGIKNFYDVGRGGVCHQVMPEKGHVRPGDVIVGSDSHTCTYGAFGAFATGIGSTEMAAVFATGKLWFRVPEVIKVDVTGNFQNLVSAKDLTLKVVGEIGADGNELEVFFENVTQNITSALDYQKQKNREAIRNPVFSYLLGWMMGLEPTTTEATTQCSTN